MTTDPNASCANPECGHPNDEHSRLAGCLAMPNGAKTSCACQGFVHPPSTPYDGGTSSGHSGSSTSHARALTEDADGTTGHRQQRTMDVLEEFATHGVTVKGLREATGWHHGQASAALSNLHHGGRIARLAEVRDRCKVYVLPEHVGDRTTESQGQRAPKTRGPITLTPAEAGALARMNTRLASGSDDGGHHEVHSLGVAFTDDLAAICAALDARTREPRQ